ncbi:MAG: hypothetical protein ACI9HK_001018 [Pirellulaceae bacterium]|jgi:hypothetical protein
MLGNHLHDGADTSKSSVEALASLQQNNATAVRTKRNTARLSTNARVKIVAGSTSDRGTPVNGVCNDVSPSGCRVISTVPLMVGDIYWVHFDKSSLELGPQFARCLRCRFMREDAYEMGFAFFSPVTLKQIDEQEENKTDVIDML